MSAEQQYQRSPNGQRFQMGGMNTVLPPDALPDGKYVYAQNVRAYLQGRTTGRATQAAAVADLGFAVHSLRRLNDTTPAGPASGYALIGGASDSLFLNSTEVATNLSENPLAMVPFRPNSSPQPWMYIGDSSQAALIIESRFGCTGMLKVRSDGLTYKMGVKEPQDAPDVSTKTTTVYGEVIVLGTGRPWSNVDGLNPSFNYGDNGNGTGPSIIATPVPGATLTFSASGTAVISGAAHNPGDAGPSGTSNPGHFVTGPVAMLLGAWCDAEGNVISGTGLGVVNIGAGVTLTVPSGVNHIQLGVNGTGGSFAGNSGQFAVNYSLTTSAVTTVPSLLGNVTAYYWGDSPQSGPVAAYIWKNAGDTGGSGPIRDISNAAGLTTNNSVIFDATPSTQASPMVWDVLDSTGTPIGAKSVFSPALESAGFQDFNMCVVGSLFIPASGTYTCSVTSKDNVMWGIGNNATWSGINTISGAEGQSMTVVSKCPLLPSPVIDGEGPATSISVAVTFPGAGVYDLELDYDYWYHSGRTLVMTCNGANIPPIAATVKRNVSYRYVGRSSATGATSNPSPASPAQSIPSVSTTITPEWMNDPQIDKIDYYRMDAGLDNFTYVGTGPNTNPPTPFVDQLLDADVAGNPLLQFDNFEPFPSIDLPKGGVVNVIGGVVEWVSGDQFNTRWLAGTIINIGGIAYVLYNRPSSPTTLLAVNVADGIDLVYEIAEPILAAQPLASMWGDTDNTLFSFACGDPLRPGTLYWSKGNNLDSAPDTNQQDVTSPSEALINGTMVNGIGMVFSAENGWMIYPNFTAALATVTGVEGPAFSLIRSGVTRGLYIRPCIASDGSGNFFYRSKDGIEMSSGGTKQQSLTDSDLYNLFPHEGFVPQPVTRAGYTVWPPDDTKPENQKLAFATGYLYYDYVDVSGTPRTIVLDAAGGGWVEDTYEHVATVHTLEEGPNVNGVLLGCFDGTVRPLVNGAVEAATCVVITSAQNGGDARANKTLGDIFLRASASSPISATPYKGQYSNQLTPPSILVANDVLSPYILDFGPGTGADIDNIGLVLSWAAGNATFLDLWQPSWTAEPENTQDRPTDWTDAGSSGPMFIQGVTLEADTFGQPKTIAVESDDGSLHYPDQNPVTFNGQSKQDLTFTPPFVAHMVRIVSTDGVPWRLWPTPASAWIQQPFPMAATEWQTEMGSLGGIGWQHIREINVAHISTADLTLTLTFDIGAVPQTIVLTVPNSGGQQAKTKVTVPRNKFKLVSFRLSSSAPFRVFAADVEVKRGIWGRGDSYNILKPFGGPTSAEVATI